MNWRIFSTVLITVLAAPALAFAQDPPDAEAVALFARMIRWTGVATSLALIAVAWIFLRFTSAMVERLSEQFATHRLLLQKIATILQFVVYVGTGISVTLLSLRLDERVLAVIGGTVAVSIGFAIKDLVAAFIAGVMIMLDRPFQVGDRVEFGGKYGDITSIGLRSVRLQTLDDNTVTIPNNKFLSEITTNGNYGALDMKVMMDFYVGADQDVVKARRIISEAAASSRYIYLPKPITVGVEMTIVDKHVAINLKLGAYVLDTRHEKSFVTDVNLRVIQGFREAQILPPAMLHRSQTPAAA